MKWILYVQFKRGKQIKHPLPVNDITLSSDTTNGQIYAFRSQDCKGLLRNYTVNFGKDGILIEGIEEESRAGGRIFFWQRWWLIPDKEILKALGER